VSVVIINDRIDEAIDAAGAVYYCCRCLGVLEKKKTKV
jgi:hypothetical protein